MTESDAYDAAVIDAAHAIGLRFYAGVACFSDHGSNFHRLAERPELWPILESGERRAQMEWYIGISPTDRTHQQEILHMIASIATTYPIDGLFLDFVRWPLHWEIELRSGRPRALDSSFDATTLAKFQEAIGALPRIGLDRVSSQAAWIRQWRFHEWVDFKCKVVTDFVGAARRVLKEASPDAELGIYLVPDVDGLTEPLTGQRISDLAPLVDWASPMLYHNILMRPPSWVGETLVGVVANAGRKTLPVVQADSNRDPTVAADWGPSMSDEDWSVALAKVAAQSDVGGLIVFPGTAIVGKARSEESANDDRQVAMNAGTIDASETLLRAKAINKRFGAVVALQDVSMELPRGQITGLVGDNGAGKSTLIKILSGVLRPDSGSIEFDRAPANFSSPAHARAHGVETVYQDLALAGNLTVWANVYLGRELTYGPSFMHILDKHAMLSNTREMLKRFVRYVPPVDEWVELLSGGQRQVVAIARAGAWGSKLILMDEPTAALGVAETKAVEEVILGLRRQGLTVLVISHNLDQIFRITSGVWVLRRGRMIGYRETRTTRPEDIVSMITGASTFTRPD